jgi:FkbM family methyltransferase
MNSIRFYFDHSLVGYFYRRAKRKLYVRPKSLNYHGVDLQLDVLALEIQDSLLTGTYESQELELLRAFVDPADRVLEVGSAIGFIGLYCRKILKVSTYVGVEPNPRTLACLHQNYKMNGLTPIVIEAAFANEDGPVSLHVSEMFWGDSLIAQSGTTKVTVQGLTLSSIIQRAGIQFNTLIVDVEGAEKYLRASVLPDCVTKIMIELHPAVLGAMSAYAVLEDLIRAGFSVKDKSDNCFFLTRT